MKWKGLIWPAACLVVGLGGYYLGKPQRVDLVDLNKDGALELVVETNFGYLTGEHEVYFVEGEKANKVSGVKGFISMRDMYQRLDVYLKEKDINKNQK